MKYHLWLFVGLSLAAGILHAQDAKLLSDDELSQLRREATRTHPAAAAAHFRAQATERDADAIRLWDDPAVGLALTAANQEMRRSNGDIRIGFDQPLPRSGLYAARREQADALSRAGTEDARAAALNAGTAAAKTAIELALLDDSLGLQKEQLQWLSAMAENSRERSINPGSTSADALRLESELARETEILHAAERTRKSIAGQLNLALGRSLASPWPQLALPDAPPPVPVAAAEIARIPKVNPTILALRQMASAATAGVRVADRERQPQFAVGVETKLYSGGDVVDAMVGVKMTLPWGNRRAYDAASAAAGTRASAAAADIESARREIAARVLAATTEAANDAAQARAFGGEIHAKAKLATESLQASWINSDTSLTDLLDSNRSLFSIRLAQRRFVAAQLGALEDILLLVPKH